FLSLSAESGIDSQLEKLPADSANVLATVLSGSQFLGELLLANPGLLSIFDFQQLQSPRRKEGLRREIKTFLEPKLTVGDYAEALAELRRFKQREILRIAARDLGRLSNVVEITRELSDIADICLDSVLRIVSKQFSEKYGQP